MSKSQWEVLLAAQIEQAGLPEPVREWRFCPERRWRADFGWPERKVMLEVEGGVWVRGRHTRGSGFTRDCEKYNTAALMGITVLRVTSQMVEDGSAIQLLQDALERSETCT